MLERVADYIQVERGVIPQEICTQVLATIGAGQWQPNIWYDNASGKTYSEANAEPDALFASNDVMQLLYPSILRATQLYVEKCAYKGSARTEKIVNYFSNVRFNRYGPGQVMRKHHDHIHAIFDGENKGIPVLSFVGNLNADYEGGELAFFDGGTKFKLGAGDICMFPSCFLYPHEVLEVSKGQRISFALWGW